MLQQGNVRYSATENKVYRTHSEQVEVFVDFHFDPNISSKQRFLEFLEECNVRSQKR